MADEAKDQPAADYIKGYEVPHRSAVYRETISDARLRKVSDYVRAWLYARPEQTAQDDGPPEVVKDDEEEVARGRLVL